MDLTQITRALCGKNYSYQLHSLFYNKYHPSGSLPWGAHRGAFLRSYLELYNIDYNPMDHFLSHYMNSTIDLFSE
jgi:hypothetical protein